MRAEILGLILADYTPDAIRTRTPDNIPVTVVVKDYTASKRGQRSEYLPAATPTLTSLFPITPIDSRSHREFSLLPSTF